MKGKSGKIAEEEGDGNDGKGGEEWNSKIKMTLLITLSPYLHSLKNDVEGTRSMSWPGDWQS
jgi:hypothetical protein